MKWAKYIFWTFYRLWFYIISAIPTVILFPVLIVCLLKDNYYPYFFRLAKIWGRFILVGMGFSRKVSIETSLNPKSSYMFVPNHVSMIDIMLILSVIDHPFVFVGKEELAKIPVFGTLYKRACILVNRNDKNSRKAVYKKVQKRLNSGLSICIFPEAGVPEEHIVLDRFKDGAFKIAIDHEIPIVPISMPDNKKRFSFTFYSGGPGKIRIKIHAPIETKTLSFKDTRALNSEVRAIILKALEKTS